MMMPSSSIFPVLKRKLIGTGKYLAQSQVTAYIINSIHAKNRLGPRATAKKGAESTVTKS